MGMYFAGVTGAGRYAAGSLQSIGIPMDPQPGPDTQEILTDVPCFLEDGSIRGGVPLEAYLKAARPGCVIYGGNLEHPLVKDYETVDFLRDPLYLALNAAITADCAMELAKQRIPRLADCPTLVLGWGRIGKCLGKKLQAAGADVTIAARKETDLAMAEALGYHGADIGCLSDSVNHYKLIFNTVPAVLPGNSQLSGEAVKIDLASLRGLPGEDVLWARGLPGKFAPEASGTLIAQTYLRLRKERLFWN